MYPRHELKNGKKLKANLIIALKSLLLILAIFGATYLLISSFSKLNRVTYNYLWSPLALITLGFLLLLSFDKFKRVGVKGAIIIRAMAIFFALLGLIPTIESIVFYNMNVLSQVLMIFYVIDTAFVLLISFLETSTSLEVYDTIPTGWEIPPSESSKPSIEKVPLFLKVSLWSKVTYYSGPDAGREVIFPSSGLYLRLKRFATIEEKFFENQSPLKINVNCIISKVLGKYKLMPSKIIFKAADVQRNVNKNIYAYLDRINVYLDGLLSSSITFLDSSAKRTSIPIINHGMSGLAVLPPVVVGVKRGYHALTLEFLDPLGKILDIVNIGFAVFNWMREGENWSVIPAVFSMSGLEDNISAAIYSKQQKLSDHERQDIEQVDEITILSVKIGTSFMRKESDKQRVKDFEVMLEILDDCFLKAIDITINDSIKLKFVTRDQILLWGKHRYVLRLPLPLLIDLPIGKHTLILRLLGARERLKPWEKERELLAFTKEFTCKGRRK